MLKKTFIIKLKLKSYNIFYLTRVIFWLSFFYKKSEQLSIIFLPIRKELFTVLRSPHVDKKARDQFERRTYVCAVSLKIQVKQTNILKYISRLNYCLSFFSYGVETQIFFFNILR